MFARRPAREVAATGSKPPWTYSVIALARLLVGVGDGVPCV